MRDNFPLPVIEDLFDNLKDKQYFSILDLKSGFHQIKISPECTKYTSFVTPSGQFEYLRVPFGLCNAPAVFQRYINKIFAKLIKEEKLCVYLDDILIATKTIAEHFEVLQQVFEILSENLLEINLEKCKFLFNEIDYLGYTVNNKGRKPNSSHIETVKNFPIPQNSKDIHRFLGLMSYFRKFIQNFAVIARPLYNLLQKDAVFYFNEEESNAFNLLKQKLITAPILAIFDPLAETELHCDASSFGFGAILLQKQSDNKFHPVSFFSKKTDDYESKLHSFELETLAVIHAIKRFHVYLAGKSFKIFTDCNALVQTLKKKEINPKINRWALFLESYDFDLEYRKEEKMKHVDALSRLHMSEKSNKQKEKVTENIIGLLNDSQIESNIIIAQEQDLKLKNIKQYLETSTTGIKCTLGIPR